MMKHILLIPVLILATACTTDAAQNIGQATSDAAIETRDGLTEAALSPLEDFNLRRDEIPASLADSENPYDIPETLDCVEIGRRIGQLNGILGRDWDSAAPEERLRSERLADAAANATLSTIAAEARGLIPFRSTIRKASGAEKHEKRYKRAIQMGKERRAYLKGIGQAMDCPAPARPAPMPTDDIEMDDRLIFKRDHPSNYEPPQPSYEAPAKQPSAPIKEDSLSLAAPTPAETTSSYPTAPPDQHEAPENDPQEWPF